TVAQDGGDGAPGRVAGASEGLREVRSCVSRLRADGAGAVWRDGSAGGASVAAGAARVFAGRQAAAIRVGLARGVAADAMASDGGGCGDLCIRQQRGVSFGAGAG